MILAWDNKADDATVSASSALSALPAANVQNEHVSKVWSTSSGVTSASLIFDMLSSVACSLLAIMGTNLSAAGTWRLRGSDSDSTGQTGEKYDTSVGSPSANSAANVNPLYGSAHLSFTEATARYWRLDLVDASLTDGIEVGRVFLGPKWSPTYAQGFGWSMMTEDPSKKSRSYGGQSYADVKPQRLVIEFTLEFMSEAEMYGNAFAMSRAAGVVGDVLAVNDSASSAYQSEQRVFGQCAASEPVTNYERSVYRQKFRVEERL